MRIKSTTREALLWGICLLMAMVGTLFSGMAMAASSKEVATVKLWNWNIHDKKYQQKMYKEFNKEHSDIKIEYSSISNTVYDQTLQAAFIAKSPPDLFLPSDGLKFEFLRTKGWLMPLNDLAPTAAELKEWMARYPAERRPFLEGSNVFDGKVYTFGLEGDVGGYFPLFWNKTLFAKAGIGEPPSTYTELRKTAAKITQAGQGKYFGIVHGLRYGGAWDADLTCSLAQAGGFPSGSAGGLPVDGRGFDRRTGKYVYSGPEFINAFKVWIGMRADGSVYPGETSMEDEQAKMVFATNKAAMIFGGPWNVSNHYAYNADADFDVVLAPTPDDGVRRGYYTVWGTGGTSGYVVSSFVKNPRAVWEVIKFITSLEYQEGYVKGGYGASYLPAANKRENFSVPQMAKFVEWGLSTRPFGPFVGPEAQKVSQYLPGIYPTVRDVLDSIYLGKAGFEALKDLDKRLDEALDTGIKRAQEAGVKVKKGDFIFPDWDPAVSYVPKSKK